MIQDKLQLGFCASVQLRDSDFSFLLTLLLPLSQHVTNSDWKCNKKRPHIVLQPHGQIWSTTSYLMSLIVSFHVHCWLTRGTLYFYFSRHVPPTCFFSFLSFSFLTIAGYLSKVLSSTCLILGWKNMIRHLTAAWAKMSSKENRVDGKLWECSRELIDAGIR